MIDMLRFLVAPREIIDECVQEEAATVKAFGLFTTPNEEFRAKRLWFANELFLHQPGTSGSCSTPDVETAFWGLANDTGQSRTIRETTSEVFGHARVFQATDVNAWKAWLDAANLRDWAERSLADLDDSESLWVCVCGEPNGA